MGPLDAPKAEAVSTKKPDADFVGQMAKRVPLLDFEESVHKLCFDKFWAFKSTENTKERGAKFGRFFFISQLKSKCEPPNFFLRKKSLPQALYGWY